jgi:cysteine-rich repeat protein
MLGLSPNPRAIALVALFGLTACPPDDPGTSDTGSTTTTGTTTSSTTEEPTTDSSTSTGTSTSTSTTDTDTTEGPICGDGVVEGAEECDDGNADNSDDCLDTCVLATCGDGFVRAGVEACDDGNDQDTDACLSSCVKATCGDGFVHKNVEQCDNGDDNAFGVYGGCDPFCFLGPHCGDGLLDDEEQCDDGNDGDPADGCLDGCVSAVSCKSIKEGKPDAETGIYEILPDVQGIDESVQVWCDMETDGGGYTFLKVDVAQFPNSPAYSAAIAEAECAKYGLHLFVPRSPDHAAAAYDFAVKQNLAPVGGGIVPADPSYMTILGIYPVMTGQSCVDQPLNSDACPQWRAGDDGPFWVTDTPVAGQPSMSNCQNCSMYYEWSNDGTVQTYIALGQGGFSSHRFLCDIGDKWE